HLSAQGSDGLALASSLEALRQRIVGVELVEIPVSADGRAGPAVARALPVVESLYGSGRETAAARALRQTPGFVRNVVNYPMDPGQLRSARIGRVRVVDDERKAPGALRGPGPVEGR